MPVRKSGRNEATRPVDPHPLPGLCRQPLMEQFCPSDWKFEVHGSRIRSNGAKRVSRRRMRHRRRGADGSAPPPAPDLAREISTAVQAVRQRQFRIVPNPPARVRWANWMIRSTSRASCGERGQQMPKWSRPSKKGTGRAIRHRCHPRGRLAPLRFAKGMTGTEASGLPDPGISTEFFTQRRPIGEPKGRLFAIGMQAIPRYSPPASRAVLVRRLRAAP